VHPQKRQFIHMKRTRMHCNYCPRDAGATSARTGIARLSFLCRLTNNRFYFPLVSVNGFRALFHWLFQCRPFAFSLRPLLLCAANTGRRKSRKGYGIYNIYNYKLSGSNNVWPNANHSVMIARCRIHEDGKARSFSRLLTGARVSWTIQSQLSYKA
jgi:hypothetical protein